ncbi:P-loop containing nucleoside triphosphate hydrolase protein [Lentinula guzmanii]|uniref:P-loop containing nucleoside triphosphate hydrolase protein n=1 Tax=Lentinula guzmanii TaxID=2804957 RepID=A0AA38JJV0_9AGAR|nr:P-loop containing nucleoside triphosphate hydrolase protein [Lentinula guzmanii]
MESQSSTQSSTPTPVPMSSNGNALNKSMQGQPTPKRKTRSPDSTSTKRQKTTTQAPPPPPPPTLRLSSLGGLSPSTHQKLLEYIFLPLLHPEIYTHTGIQPPRGVLFHGPPGCGKTMLAEAVGGELNWILKTNQTQPQTQTQTQTQTQVGFVKISAPELVSGMSGESERALRDAFAEAKRQSPSILFIDEIDAVTPKRENAQREMERRIVAQFLTCMDELLGQGVIVIGATNRADSLDPALRRAGRFDHEISMGVPDEEARERILKVLTSSLRLEPGFDFANLAKSTPGYVGADLASLTSTAGIIAVKRIFNANLYDFLITHPSPLNPTELSPLLITSPDFSLALSQTQPSSKREGFATIPDVTWSDIGFSSSHDNHNHNLLSIRDQLRLSIVSPIKHPSLFSSVGISSASGVLLWGPPGCGKTLLAKAVANESQANFISIKGPELLNKYIGESERAVRLLFARARASAPCVVFFDEIDALVPRREDTLSESSSRVVNTLLAELDGLEKRDLKSVYVVAASNRPDMVDPAMTRPGRLDKMLFVGIPTSEERVGILRTVLRGVPVQGDVSVVEELVGSRKCDGYTGADVRALVREAGVGALKRSLGILEDGFDEPLMNVTVLPQDFFDAQEKVVPSVSEEERRRYEMLRDRMLGIV